MLTDCPTGKTIAFSSGIDTQPREAWAGHRGRSVTVAAHLSADELKARYRRARDPVERSHLQVIWLLARQHTQAAIAAATGYSTRQIRTILRRYNEGGPEALGDRRRRHLRGKPLPDVLEGV